MSDPRQRAPSATSKVKNWMKTITDGNKTLGRMIDEAFPDQESIFPEKNKSPGAEAPKVARPASEPLARMASGFLGDKFERPGDSHGAEEYADKSESDDNASVSPENVARIPGSKMKIKDSLHPWGIVDYFLLNKYVSANALDTKVPGMLVLAEPYTKFFKFEEIASADMNEWNQMPKLVFARIPLVDNDGVFGNEIYVLYFDLRSYNLRVRHFQYPPKDIFQIAGIWEDGKDIYAFNEQMLFSILCGSVDNSDGALLFPYLDRTESRLDRWRADHPGLQLVILNQCVTFVAKVQEAIHTRDSIAQENIDVAELKQVMHEWLLVLDRASFELWANYKSGVRKEEFVRRICVQGAVSDALGFTMGKTQTALQVIAAAPDPSDAASVSSFDMGREAQALRSREEEALRRTKETLQRRRKEKLQSIFVEPTAEERSTWEKGTAPGSSLRLPTPSKPINIPKRKKAGGPLRFPGWGTPDAKTAIPKPGPPPAAPPSGDPSDDPEPDCEWPPHKPMTTLLQLVNCLQSYVEKHPGIDNANTRILCRNLFTDLGITAMESRGRDPKIVHHPFDKEDGNSGNPGN